MNTRKIVIVGGGGHAKVVIDAIKSSGKYSICGLVDPALKKGDIFCGVSVLGGDSALSALFKKGVRSAFIGIGSIGNCDIRKRIYDNLKKIGFDLPVVVHPKALVAEGVSVGEGAFIAAGAVVAPGAKIGKNVIINTSSSVDHDCVIGDFVHVAPGATLSGGISVGSETHIGTGAKVTQYLKIGDRCIIGAGQTVRHDMTDREKSYISPVRPSKKNSKVFIIAEAGVNHNGSVKLAKKLIDVASSAGADAVKFQTFKAEKVITEDARKADYQIRNTGTREKQFKMLEALELSDADFRDLYRYCRVKGIEFMSSPFDLESVDLLNSLGMKRFKIPSGEITNKPLIQHIASKNKPIILSTGMSSLEEVARAVEWINEIWGRYSEKPELTLLHCVSNYPALASDVNLSAMKTMERSFKLPAGYSDHTMGIEIPLAAAAMGARVIEKHFTLDRKMKGPDHKASLEPDELCEMVAAIRKVEKAIGDGIKRPCRRELDTMVVARRSLVAARDISRGEIIRHTDIAVKRPGTGMQPDKIGSVVDRYAVKDIKRDSLILERHIAVRIGR